MTAYRLFLMSNRTGHIERWEVIEARDDGDAVRLAGRLAGPQVMELWQEARRIHRFECGTSDQRSADTPPERP